MITMTGSTPTGKVIFKSAAQNLTQVQPELEGKPPFTVLRGADIELAVEGVLHPRFIIAGQVSICKWRRKATGFSYAKTVGRPYLHEASIAQGNANWITAVASMFPIF